jgi:MOSC domain-containing protein YiiM
MRIVSLNLGRPRIVVRAGRQYSTAIDRRPVDGPVELTPEGFVGDRVADNRWHGGPDKAICCYPHEHYAHWSRELGVKLEIPSFGENFTTQGLLEREVCIGDRFRVGDAVLQVTQPRQPCWKLAGKHNQPALVKWIVAKGFTGFYLRAAPIAAGRTIELLERPHPEMPVDRAMWIMAGIAPPEGRAELAALPELSQDWRESLLKPAQ